jgi:hypothetical protein
MNVPPSIPSRSVGAEAPLLAAFSQKGTVATSASGVPDLRGLDARAAIARATAAGLLVRAQGSGVVQSQQPSPGEALPVDKRVLLTLAMAEGAR